MIILSLIGLVSCDQEPKETRERVIGYMGRARQNPYLAAKRYLQAGGHEVASMSGVLKFSDDEGLVFTPASSIRSVGDTDRVMDWVDEGGHLVVFLQRGEDYWYDLGEVSDHDPELWAEDGEELSGGVELMLQWLDLEVVEEWEEGDKWDRKESQYASGEVLPNVDECIVSLGGEEKFTLLLGGHLRIQTMDGEYFNDWKDQGEQHRFYSREYGYGRVTLLTDARAFRNPYLGMADHAKMLDYLAIGGGAVVFSLGEVPGFLTLLKEHGWMGLWGILALLVVWLWKNMPRFGPILDVEEGHSRNYAQQVMHAGKFFWRSKREDVLLLSLQDAVRSRSGHMQQEAVHSTDLYEKLAQSSGIDYEMVEDAMTRREARDAATMVKTTRTLQLLLQSI
ncbi:DUF4350 domain-containing protein [Rubritalea tangerina]|uniref:DUF4350 domain-containing protein n=2 Tax=Rubritalea tangerina TaxID=430798 RepID=A0ABW4Z6S4_9BACT